jgi:RNA-binding protein YhbY
MNKAQNIQAMRKQAIANGAKALNKVSKFYREDYAAMCSKINKKTPAELIETIGRQGAIAKVSAKEVISNCQF